MSKNLFKKIAGAIFNKIAGPGLPPERFLAVPLTTTGLSVTFFDSVDNQSFKPGWSQKVSSTDIQDLDIPVNAKRFSFSKSIEIQYSNYSYYSSCKRVGGAYVVVDVLPAQNEINNIGNFLLKSRDYGSVTFIDRNKNCLLEIPSKAPSTPPKPSGNSPGA